MGDTFEQQWAVLELLGHVRVAGKVTEEEHFGGVLGRIDIPDVNGGFTTQYFGGSSIYRLMPTTEEIARAVALTSQPEPIHPWELPARCQPPIVPARWQNERDAAEKAHAQDSADMDEEADDDLPF